MATITFTRLEQAIVDCGYTRVTGLNKQGGIVISYTHECGSTRILHPQIHDPQCEDRESRYFTEEESEALDQVT